MGIEVGETFGVGRPDMRSGREDAGPATTPTSTSNFVRRWFSRAAQPEIIRAAQNDYKGNYIAICIRSPTFQGVDVLGLKKCGQGLPSWIRVDAATGDSQVIEVDKFTIMRRCDLPARDLRLLDPLFVYPSTILGKEKAIVVNLKHICCIITADEVVLLNSLDSYVLQYMVELQRRLKVAGGGEVWQSEGAELTRRMGNSNRSLGDMFGNTSPEYFPL
ncbi:unnamed protein product [Lactuca virosa]|uniref:Magnesium transporter n=1 Tax=Lactuca virosa TaxID=75947 RepID=A0AAU9NJP3_9ASTR|nr:unnamed protein product [Lactuca virosa]